MATPALAHKALYELIQSSAFLESGSSPLFEAADDVQKKLVSFLEACETGADKANNPLEDYRLLFNFDLEIRVGDKKVDSLSKRLGVGSNGEHLVPGVSRGRAAFLRAAVLVSNALSGLRLTDAHCGLRAFRARALPSLRITQDRMAHASQLLARIKAARLTVREVPVTVAYTAYSKAKGQGGLQAVRVLFDTFFRTG